jgi:cyanophycinase
MGYIVLQGGAEFGGKMAQSDRRSLALAGGTQARVAIVPTAAVPERNHRRAGENGRHWFEILGGRQVEVLPLTSELSAEDPAVSKALKASNLIYLLGGLPGYLAKALSGTPAWEAVQSAHMRGAVVAGSSAGAMVLCDVFYDPYGKRVMPGLGMVTGCCVVPHHDTSGRRWVAGLQKDLPGHTIIGIDEQTGMIDDGPDGSWNVYGRGVVTLYGKRGMLRFGPGSPFRL